MDLYILKSRGMAYGDLPFTGTCCPIPNDGFIFVIDLDQMCELIDTLSIYVWHLYVSLFGKSIQNKLVCKIDRMEDNFSLSYKNIHW